MCNKTSVECLGLVSNRCDLFSQHSLLKVFCRHSLRICKRGWKWSSCLGENMIFIFFHQLSVWIHFSVEGFFSPTLSLGTFSAQDEICWSLRHRERERERESMNCDSCEARNYFLQKMHLQMLHWLFHMGCLPLVGGGLQVCSWRWVQQANDAFESHEEKFWGNIIQCILCLCTGCSAILWFCLWSWWHGFPLSKCGGV